MKIAYAMRRSVFYPYRYEHLFPVFLPPEEIRASYLKKVRSMGFDGIELGIPEAAGADVSEKAARNLAQELRDAGVPCVVIRGGGGMHSPRVAARNRAALETAVKVAGWMGAEVVNTTVLTSPVPTMPGANVGEVVSQGSSRDASQADYEATSKGLAEIADRAAGVGVQISIEVHQLSIADNSWSALHLLEMIDRPNVGINPDLGNIYWTYDVPEQTCEDAIVALAPHANYWHCKNMYRVHIPENEHALFIRQPLPDGEIDYRFAVSAMMQAGYKGYLAIEGVQLGDQLTRDMRSVDYVKALIAEIRTK